MSYQLQGAIVIIRCVMWPKNKESFTNNELTLYGTKEQKRIHHKVSTHDNINVTYYFAN